jgi:predicted transcriptional regulator
MPRSKVYPDKRIQTQIRLPPALYKRLDKEARRRGVSRTYLIERAIDASLPGWEKEKLT